ncbi:MAG: TonB-dependent receptor [Acidobacteria bacterium]|nr:TonB-dependent receptor [Acidobacteriota bacterium]
MKFRWIGLLLIAALAVTSAASAQVSTSTITGVVSDKTGAVIAGAKVTATREGTGVEFTTTTTDSGAFTFASLVPGLYSITIEKEGFQKFISSKNNLTVGTPLVINAEITVGAVTSIVQVESTYQRLETSNATISDVMTENQVKNLPLNGRNPLSLLTLEPGVVQRSFNGAGSGTHVFGSRDRAHNITIDGIDANESTVPNPQSNIQRLNPDNVQEFRAVTLGATAENGRNSGANVMVGTKTGSNGLHGAAYYFNRNTAFASNEWFNNATGKARPDLKLNQWGFDVGGPIIKNRTFFFGSYQGNIIKQSAPIVSFFGLPITYTASARAGIWRFVRGTVTAGSKTFTQNSTGLVDSAGNLLSGVATCGGAVTTNCVDSYNMLAAANLPAGVAGFDPAVSGLINSLPLPNTFVGGGDGLNTAGFGWNPPTKFAGPHFLVRVDHTFGPNDNIFVRWLQNKFDTTEGDFINARPRVYPGFAPLGEVTRIGRNLAVSYRHTFSPTIVNELTMGFNRFAFKFTFGESNPGFGDPTKDRPWADSCIYGSFLLITGPDCVSPHTQRAVTVPQLVDNITWTHGAHTFRMGINFRFYYHNDSRGFFGGTIAAPGILFNGSATGRQAGFLNIPSTASAVPAAQRPSSTDINNLQQSISEQFGFPFTISQSFVADFTGNAYKSTQYATVYTRAHQWDSFIQDEWKIRPNVTLNLGLRWELNPAPYDKRSTFAPNLPLSGSLGPVAFGKSNRWFHNNNTGAFAPRIGIAWSPDQKTSVRLGYALLFDVISTFQVTAIAGKMPGFMLGCSTNTTTAGVVSVSAGCVAASGTTNRISTGFPVTVPAPSTTPSAVAGLFLAGQPSNLAPAIGAFDQNMKNPAVHEWNLTIQRELWQHFVAEVGYIGKRGTHLQMAYDINQANLSSSFISGFNVARQNFLNGCAGDGTGCPVGVTGVTPTFLLTLTNAAFITSSTSATDLLRGNVGNFAARLDALSAASASRLPALTFNFFRPNGQFGQVFYQDSGGDSYYHAAYFSLRRRFEKGLDLGFSYTLSKSIDVLSVDPTGAATGGGLSSTSFSRTPTDVTNIRLDRALSDFNNKHVVQTNLLYELPFGKGKRWMSGVPNWTNQVIGGWQWTGIFIYQSGEPYTMSSGFRTSNAGHDSTALIVGPNIAGGELQRVNGITGPVLYQTVTAGLISSPLNDPHLNCVNVTGSQTFFCVPPPGANGSGRNRWQGPNYWNLDGGLLKQFDITERFKLQFRAEFFNILNHPNFENPRNSTGGSATISSTLFGQTCCSTAAVASAQQVNPVGEPMRVIQLGLKVNF